MRIALSIGIGEGFLYLIERQPKIGDDDLRVIEAFPEFLDPALHHTADQIADLAVGPIADLIDFLLTHIIFLALFVVVPTFIHLSTPS